MVPLVMREMKMPLSWSWLTKVGKSLREKISPPQKMMDLRLRE